MAAFDGTGKGPGTSLHFLTIHFKSLSVSGNAAVNLSVNDFSDALGDPIGSLNGIGSTVTISGGTSNFLVTPIVGNGGTVNPNTAQTVAFGATMMFTVTPNSGYIRNNTVVGTCPQGSWNGSIWKTGPIIANCTVTFSFTQTITPPTVTTSAATAITTTSATLNGSVTSGATASVTFDFGSTTTYGTSVAATPGSVYSSSAVAVSANKTGLTCGTTYHYRIKAANSVGTSYGLDNNFTTSTCPPINGVCGTANGGTYTAAPATNLLCGVGTASEVSGTGPWTWSCAGSNGGTTASCAANIATYTVTGSTGTDGSVSPSSQTIKHGAKATFTVTPNVGYDRNSAIGGTCPPGTWSGNVWTTGTIIASCNVSFSFTLKTYTVTGIPGTGGSVSPSSQTVNHGAQATFTVTPNSDYTKNIAVGGTCLQGTWNGNVWTTGSIATNCSVSFSFTPIPINGVCGSANGGTFYSAPTTNLCSTGTVSGFSGSGPWNWSCNGSNGGTTANCSANLQTAVINSWLYPTSLKTPRDKPFTLEVTAKSDGMQIITYSFTITFDAKLMLDPAFYVAPCNQGICPGNNALTENAITVDNRTGTINVTGVGGMTAAGNDLQLLVIHFKSLAVLGASIVDLKTNVLMSNAGNIGLGARGSTVNISTGICGDANGDTVVNIIDALAIARKVVGLPPPPTIEPLWADVDYDSRASIVDALQIARYSVGLLTPPEVCVIGMAF